MPTKHGDTRQLAFGVLEWYEARKVRQLAFGVSEEFSFLKRAKNNTLAFEKFSKISCVRSVA